MKAKARSKARRPAKSAQPTAELNDNELAKVTGGNLITEAMHRLKHSGEVLSSTLKTRSEISQTIARNARV